MNYEHRVSRLFAAPPPGPETPDSAATVDLRPVLPRRMPVTGATTLQFEIEEDDARAELSRDLNCSLCRPDGANIVIPARRKHEAQGHANASILVNDEYACLGLHYRQAHCGCTGVIGFHLRTIYRSLFARSVRQRTLGTPVKAWPASGPHCTTMTPHPALALETDYSIPKENT